MSLFICVVLTYYSAVASPVEVTDGRSFKIGINFSGKTLYLTESGTGATELSKGMDCKLNGDKIACGKNGQGLTYGDFHTAVVLTPTAMATNNKGWSIGSDNTISWKRSGNRDVHFSIKGAGTNQIYAEVCSVDGHPDGMMFTPGKAKAYFNESK
jgi:hypothetical protein